MGIRGVVVLRTSVVVVAVVCAVVVVVECFQVAPPYCRSCLVDLRTASCPD